MVLRRMVGGDTPPPVAHELAVVVPGTPFMIRELVLVRPPSATGCAPSIDMAGASIFYPERQTTEVFDSYIYNSIFTFTSASRWPDFLVACEARCRRDRWSHQRRCLGWSNRSRSSSRLYGRRCLIILVGLVCRTQGSTRVCVDPCVGFIG